MRITCPSCAAVYDVPTERMAGRTLKCARCAHGWVPVAAEPQAAPLPDIEPPAVGPIAPPPPMPMRAPSRVAPEPARRSWPLAAAWAATIVVLAGCGMAAVLARGDVMQAWPPSQRVYAALGLH